MKYQDYLKEQIQQDPSLAQRIAFKNWVKEIGVKISILRAHKGYTQKDLAGILKVSQTVIARIEAGNNLTCSTLFKLSEGLNIDINIFGASVFVEKNKFTSQFGTKSEYNIDFKLTCSTTLINNYNCYA